MPDLNSLLMGLLNGGQSQPAVPQQSQQQAMPAPQMQPQAQPVQQQQGPSPIAKFLMDAMAGASTVDPSKPMATAFAQGYTGASKSTAGREQSLEDRKIKMEDREFDKRMKLSAARRAESAQSRADRAAKFTEIKTVADITKAINPQLDIKDKIAIERLVRDYGKGLEKSSMEAEDVLANMDKYRKDLESRIISNKPQVQGGQTEVKPDAVFDQGSVKTNVPTKAGGTDIISRMEADLNEDQKKEPPRQNSLPTNLGKSKDSPFKFSGDVKSMQSSFESLPSGSWFINPKDGKLLQKK